MNILNTSDWNTEFYDSKMTSWVKAMNNVANKKIVLMK
jgi:hypothetical protein